MKTKREENIYQRREYLSDSYDNMNYNDANINFFYNTVINFKISDYRFFHKNNYVSQNNIFDKDVKKMLRIDSTKTFF